MELTPEAVRRAEFGRAWGGYDMREVDSFLEEIGNGVDELHARIREVTLRAERAESRGGGLDDTIKRTLTLAQRAADLVVSEAKGVAERTTGEATAHAARVVAEAKDAAQRMEAQAQVEGARVLAEHLERAQREHGALAAQLAAERSVIEELHRVKREEVAAMHEHAQTTRDALRASLADHLTRLDLLEFGTALAFDADLSSVADPSGQGAGAVAVAVAYDDGIGGETDRGGVEPAGSELVAGEAARG